MTRADATAEASEGDCSAQNNLDYVYQFTNGWMQNQIGSSIGSICKFLCVPSTHLFLISLGNLKSCGS